MKRYRLAAALLGALVVGACDPPPSAKPDSLPTAASARATPSGAAAASTTASDETRGASDVAASATAAASASPAASGATGAGKAALLDPKLAGERAPAQFNAKFVTTKGIFVVEAHRDWAPRGVDRFYNLVKIGFYDDVALYRVVKGFVVQLGLSGNPRVSAAWKDAKIQDDRVKESNKRGYVTFAMAGPDSRTTQIFVNLGDNGNLDEMGFAPIGKVVTGMEVIDKLHGGYKERITRLQTKIVEEGNSFLRESFPELDYVKSATLVP
jgi:peptidyl-prolyl cis-trans isomerase A (cyclophilin A)